MQDQVDDPLSRRAAVEAARLRRQDLRPHQGVGRKVGKDARIRHPLAVDDHYRRVADAERLVHTGQDFAYVPGAQGVDLSAVQLRLGRHPGGAPTAADLDIVHADRIVEILRHNLTRTTSSCRIELPLPHGDQTDERQPQHSVLRRIATLHYLQLRQLSGRT
ncbi:hypothetical protein D3C86_856700 [compost metagenome]